MILAFAIVLWFTNVFLIICRAGHWSDMSFVPPNRQTYLTKIRSMFDFAYNNYMQYAYPKDELDPIHCVGRGHDYADRSNININDVLGNYQLTLIDSLDTLAVFGNVSEFQRATKLIINTLSFEEDTIVQVFEANIRIIGGLLSAHLILTDPKQLLGPFRMHEYDGEMVKLARDLANRLLVAFEGTPTGIPFPRVRLALRTTEALNRHRTCLAGAGTLLLEHGVLSLLLGNASYALKARQVVFNLWEYRSRVTGLLGTDIDVFTGKWINPTAGVGAGQDSFYEYLLKSQILFDDTELGAMFEEILSSLRYNSRGNYKECERKDGHPPIFWNVNMLTGDVTNHWIDSLQFAWPSIQVLAGDVEDAKCQHKIHLDIWRRYGLPPERFNVVQKVPEVFFYPLRPEFAESTYHLYRTTKDPFYLTVGAEIVDNIEKFARTRCGYATIHNVEDKSQEDRMESFFLSETLKYLYLLFDEMNPLNVHEEEILFTTQAHILPIVRLRKLIDSLDFNPFVSKGYKPKAAHENDTPNPNFASCARVLPPKNPFVY